MAWLAAASPAAAQSADAPFVAALGELPDAGFADKEALVARLVETGHSSAGAVLTAMLEDRLYVRNSDRRVFISTSADDTQPSLSLLDPLTLKKAGAAPVAELTKIGTNNRLRRSLRTTSARFALSNPDAGVRLAAVTDMLRSLDDATADLLRQRLPQESDAGVKREIERLGTKSTHYGLTLAGNLVVAAEFTLLAEKIDSCRSRLLPPPSMDHLDELEAQSIYILREAFARLKKLALLWSLGKDSNVMIWLARKAFFGRVPFPALHVDTGKKFPEMYAFRDRFGKEWDLDLKVEPCPPIDAVDPTLPPAARSAARKTEGLKWALTKYGFDGLIAGIRRDEEATRAKERVFSPRGLEGGWDVRDQPPEFWDQFNASPPTGAHLRIHPILHWTEADIWAYTKRENIPIIPLYLAKEGKRYRSLGDQDITNPVASTASSIDEILTELDGTKVPERAGRALDHETEDAFERLRVAGYL